MKDISTTLLGMKIKSPIVLGACNLSYMPNRLAEFEEAGIGAIVYKTLFEEQVQLESFEFDEQLHFVITSYSIHYTKLYEIPNSVIANAMWIWW